MDPLSEQELDDRQEVMFGQYGGYVDVTCQTPLLVYATGVWSEEYDRMVTVVNGWRCDN